MSEGDNVTAESDNVTVASEPTFDQVAARYTYTSGGLTPAQRVQAGADLLDEHGPDNWRQVIADNADDLDLSSSSLCVLGLVDAVRNDISAGEGYYNRELDALYGASNSVVSMAKHGFEGVTYEDGGQTVSTVMAGTTDRAALTELWRALVREPASPDVSLHRAERRAAKAEREVKAARAERDAAVKSTRDAKRQAASTRDLLALVSRQGFSADQVASIVRTFDRITERNSGGYDY